MFRVEIYLSLVWPREAFFTYYVCGTTTAVAAGFYRGLEGEKQPKGRRTNLNECNSVWKCNKLYVQIVVKSNENGHDVQGDKMRLAQEKKIKCCTKYGQVRCIKVLDTATWSIKRKHQWFAEVVRNMMRICSEMFESKKEKILGEFVR